MQPPSPPHAVQPLDMPLPELQHVHPLQLLTVHWLLAEHEDPGPFLTATQLGLLVPPQLPLREWAVTRALLVPSSFALP